MKTRSESKEKLSITEIQNELYKIMIMVDEFCKEHGIKYYLLGGSALGAVRHNGFIPWDDDIDIGMFRDDYERFIHLFPKEKGDYRLFNARNCKNANYCLTRIFDDKILIDYPSNYSNKINKHMYFDIFPIDDVPSNELLKKRHKSKIRFYNKLILLKSYYPSRPIRRILAKVINFFLLPFSVSFFSRRADLVFKKYNTTKHTKVCSMASQYSYEKQTFNSEVYGEPQLHAFRDSFFYIPEHAHEYLTQLFGYDYMTVPPKEKQRVGLDMYRIVSNNKHE